jgi:hypothetical protein
MSDQDLSSSQTPQCGRHLSYQRRSDLSRRAKFSGHITLAPSPWRTTLLSPRSPYRSTSTDKAAKLTSPLTHLGAIEGMKTSTCRSSRWIADADAREEEEPTHFSLVQIGCHRTGSVTNGTGPFESSWQACNEKILCLGTTCQFEVLVAIPVIHVVPVSWSSCNRSELVYAGAYSTISSRLTSSASHMVNPLWLTTSIIL